MAISIDEIKKELRISHDMSDGEIARKISEAKKDMKRVGVESDVDDPLIDAATTLYLKWQFDFMGKGEQYLSNYERLRDSLSLSDEYRYRDE